nr:hypothetical protein [Tanacetum cinerariifolium]
VLIFVEDSWNEEPCSDVYQVGDEREVDVPRSFNWPLSELIMDDGVLPERGYSQFNDVSLGYLVSKVSLPCVWLVQRVMYVRQYRKVRVVALLKGRLSGTGGPTALEHVVSCIVGREAHCSTGFEGRIVGCKIDPTSVDLARVVQFGTIVKFGTSLSSLAQSLITSLWFDLVDCHDYPRAMYRT